MQPDVETAIIDSLYSGACDPAELQRAIDGVARAFDCPSLFLGDLDVRDAEKISLLGAGLMDEGRIEHYKSIADSDYITPVFSRLTPGTAELTYRVLDQGKIRRLAFHDAFIRPLSIDHVLASPLHVSGSRIAMIALHQVEGRSLLDESHIAALERLAPHLARVLHARRAFLRLKERQSSYMAIVDQSATGLIALGRDGAVLFVNPAMRALAAQRDGLLLDRHGLLMLADREAVRSMARLQADVSAGGPGGYVRVSRPSGRMPYVLSVSRLPVHEEGFAPGGTLFAVIDPTDRRVPPEARIAEALGLTPGGARIVQALLAGQDLKTYADEAGLTLHTVRSHLKVAFSRTETHSQAELVRLALAVMSQFAPLRT